MTIDRVAAKEVANVAAMALGDHRGDLEATAR